MITASQYESEKTAVEAEGESRTQVDNCLPSSCFHAADAICRIWSLL